MITNITKEITAPDSSVVLLSNDVLVLNLFITNPSVDTQAVVTLNIESESSIKLISLSLVPGETRILESKIAVTKHQRLTATANSTVHIVVNYTNLY